MKDLEKKTDNSRQFRRELLLYTVFFLTLVSNVIPLLGPIIIAFLFGWKKRKWQNLGLTRGYLLAPMVLAEIICLAFILAVASYDVHFKELIPLIIIGLLVNVAALIGAFSLGVYHGKT